MSDIILRHPLVWNGLIKKDLLVNNSIDFQKDAFPREDLVFHLRLSSLNFNGIYTPKPTYIYRYAVAGSLSNTVTRRNISNHIPIVKTIIDCQDDIKDKTIGDYANKELTGTVNSFFRNILRLKRNDRNILLRRYTSEIDQTKIPRNNLNVFSKLYQISPFCYSVVADIAGVLMPKNYKISK